MVSYAWGGQLKSLGAGVFAPLHPPLGLNPVQDTIKIIFPVQICREGVSPRLNPSHQCYLVLLGSLLVSCGTVVVFPLVTFSSLVIHDIVG